MILVHIQSMMQESRESGSFVLEKLGFCRIMEKMEEAYDKNI